MLENRAVAVRELPELVAGKQEQLPRAGKSNSLGE
jgi:hypothetical protein